MIWMTLLACGAPELEDAHMEASEAYCDRAITCDWIPVAQEQECIDNLVPIFTGEWTTLDCEDNISRSGWKDCEDALAEMDERGTTIGDQIQAERLKQLPPLLESVVSIIWTDVLIEILLL